MHFSVFLCFLDCLCFLEMNPVVVLCTWVFFFLMKYLLSKTTETLYTFWEILSLVIWASQGPL